MICKCPNEKCDICYKYFKNKKALSNHKRWHDLPEYQLFQKGFSKKTSQRMLNNKLNIGRKNSSKTILKMSNVKLGSKNPIWKGNKAGYGALHEWIRNHKPKPELCVKCKKKLPYDLANVSGEYRRDVNDFEWLCRKCHMRGDNRINNLKQFRGKK